MKRLTLISASFLIVSSAFAQSEKCVTTNAKITGNQVTLTSSGAKSVTEKQTYVYYERRHHKKHDKAYSIAGINDQYPSRPLLMTADKNVKAMPEAYNVSLSTPQKDVSVCPDSTLDVSANINVEKISSYTGNYPQTDNKVYKKVSKRDYLMARRKIYKMERKEDKVARKTHMEVDVKSAGA